MKTLTTCSNGNCIGTIFEDLDGIQVWFWFNEKKVKCQAHKSDPENLRLVSRETVIDFPREENTDYNETP